RLATIPRENDMPTEIGTRRLMSQASRAAGGLLLIVSLQAQVTRASSPDGTDLFESKVRPIFIEHCQKCHGGEKQWAGLRLDSRASALTGGDSGPATVAGQPHEGELLRRVSDPDDDLRMPPTKEGPRLNAEQIAAIKKWIAAGA